MSQTTIANQTSAVVRSWQDAARLIDHTLLKPEATREQVLKICREAADYGFFSVMINPTNIATCVSELRGTSVVVGTVIGFPLGASTSTTKLAESADALRLGARELDMVINIGALKGKDDILVGRDIRGVVEVCKDSRALCKVILETALLTDEEKVRACQLSMKAGADFVKTSTGFSKSGATPEDISLMARTVAPRRLGVKASGGVRTYQDLVKMVNAGATRIGSSNSIKIVEEAKQASGAKG